MPLPRSIPRPSTLPLSYHVTDLMPPPSVPSELATPSPVRPRPSLSFKARPAPLQNKEVVRKLSSKSTDQDTSDDGRGSSVSPTLQPKVVRLVQNRTKAVPKTSSGKFARSLNQHIQESGQLYLESGMATDLIPSQHTLPAHSQTPV